MKQNRKVWIATSMCVLSMLSTRVDGQTQATNSPYNWDNLPEIQQPIFRKDTLDIRDFGAKGDGMTLNTKSINDAIAASNQNQGGVVFIPAGYWLSGPIELKSNVNLHLADNAFLQFTADFDQYPIVEGNYEGKPSARNQSPISGKNLKNIAITGAGTIDGNGDAWRMVGRGALTEREWRDKVAAGGLVSADGKTWFPSEKTKRAHEEKRSVLLTEERTLADFEDIKDYLRPNLLVLTNCEKVLLEGVTFQNSPAWNLHPLMSRHVTIRDVKIKNPDYAQNGDGIDIESCSNVLIEDCILDVGDDAICIKSGKDEEGRKRGIPTEKVIIRRNKVYLGHGGFVVGSEMSGGARDIFVENCTFMGTDKGIRFKTTRGRGGIVENIHIRDINMSNIVDEAIFFDMYYWTKPPQANEVQEIPPVTEETPKIRNVFIENVQCNGAKVGVFVRGLPEMPVQHIHLKNLNLTVDKGIEIKDTQFLTIENAAFYTASDAPLLYVESAQDLTFNKLKLDNKQPHRVEIHGSNSTNILLTDSKIDSGNISFHNGAKKQGIKIN
ncbi:glycoside hydrolase family 28 protein [Sphingobacterium sp. FBM7-1]|uniref:glycoside hydrolase family 28 protein n=1 Tax=Sphingobacterium sp. FBM7-1 TaxID=2886688 RepID=UPI001D1265E4|nr:glycoside hydrolase family 28 protein [Sphingobacterium sp. FBM7-1]MCC2600722.1 glycoside hydrolase family 28 protein [Sphingobacterium sp. FBM7-1]